MIKLLYLLAGVSLTQTVNEFNALVREYVESLKKLRESVATYRGNPAIMFGSKEAAHFEAKREYDLTVAPELKKLSKRIARTRLVPVAIYAVATASLIGVIVWLEREAAKRASIVPATSQAANQTRE